MYAAGFSFASAFPGPAWGRPRWRASITAALLTGLLLSSQPAAGRARWLLFETDNLRVLSQVQESKSLQILRELQVFRAALSQFTNVADTPPRVPTTVFLLDHAAFEQAARGYGEVAGLFIGQPFRNYILIDASKSTRRSLAVAYHEYVHFQLRNNGNLLLPAFYEEGLAQLAQYLYVRGRQVHYGFFPSSLSTDARSTEMPLRRLLQIDAGSDEYRNHRSQPGFYARSLLWLHYCLVGNTNCEQPLTRMVARMMNGDDAPLAFAEEFRTSPEEFDRQLDNYVKRAPDLYVGKNVTTVLRSRPPTQRSIAASKADLEYAWLLLGAGRDVTMAEEFIRPALASQPKSPAALTALAVWHERSGRPADADQLIAQVLEAGGAQAPELTRLAFLILGRAIALDDTIPARSRELRAAARVQADRSREILGLALQREPASIEAAYGLGLTQLVAPDNVRASLPIIAAAAQRFPQSGELSFVLAVQLGMTGQERDARRLLRIAACRVIDAQLREFARQRLGSISCTPAH